MSLDFDLIKCPKCGHIYPKDAEPQPILKKEWSITSPRNQSKLTIQLWKCPVCKKTWRKTLK